MRSSFRALSSTFRCRQNRAKSSVYYVVCPATRTRTSVSVVGGPSKIAAIIVQLQTPPVNLMSFHLHVPVTRNTLPPKPEGRFNEVPSRLRRKTALTTCSGRGETTRNTLRPPVFYHGTTPFELPRGLRRSGGFPTPLCLAPTLLPAGHLDRSQLLTCEVVIVRGELRDGPFHWASVSIAPFWPRNRGPLVITMPRKAPMEAPMPGNIHPVPLDSA
jgi:hypothetical protein